MCPLNTPIQCTIVAVCVGVGGYSKELIMLCYVTIRIWPWSSFVTINSTKSAT